jgi:cob(I)alamin adenosyltransferase
MTEQPFDEPRRIVLNRIYMRTGDDGRTSLVGGQRVPKHALRIECYGTVDELNAVVGVARTTLESLDGTAYVTQLAGVLKRVQHELFNLGSILATLPEDVSPKQPRITAVEIERLEREIDQANESLPILRSFVLPGGSRPEAELHVARTVCRRAERLLVALSEQETTEVEPVQYLNRLSDALFVWSRRVNVELGREETLWAPNAAASGSSGPQ